MIRSHITNNKFLDLDLCYLQCPKEMFPYKPVGLWYAIGGQWRGWCQSSHYFHWVGSNEFVLELDMSRILIIKELVHLRKFCDKYGLSFEGTRQRYILGIDWKMVAVDYADIEFPTFRSLKDSSRFFGSRDWLDYLWIDAIDIDSGCIWDLSIIRGHRLLTEVEKEQLNRFQDDKSATAIP